LQYLFEFQTQVALLTGMEVANASMYDGSTACAEAVMMANRVTRRTRAILSGGLHPHYAEVTRTQARWTGFDAVDAPPDILDAENGDTEDLTALIDDRTSCVVVQNPKTVRPGARPDRLAAACHAKGALLVVVVTEIVSLGLLTAPGDMARTSWWPRASRWATR